MNMILFEKTKLAAYFLWDYSEFSNALSHWYCIEDIACHFERNGILTISDMDYYKRKNKYDPMYVDFIRNIAYRIHIYTNDNNSYLNWLMAEKLVKNHEWCEAMVTIAAIYNTDKTQRNFTSMIRSSRVKEYYNGYSDNKEV